MLKVTRILQSKTVGIHPLQDVLILKKDIFDSTIDAGKIDNFIELLFPGLINRDLSTVNGVSVTRDEIVITLNGAISDIKTNSIIQALQQNSW